METPEAPHSAASLSTQHFDNDIYTLHNIADNIIAPIPNADRTQILGEMIDNEDNTNTSMNHRLTQAETCFWANFRNLRKPGTAAKKIKA